MKRFVSYIRDPVRRAGAEQYLLISLLSFAVSVIVTRLFLELTGYPQIGNSTLHIAHVLWGGLLLFIAALLPLLLANRWVYTVGGLLSGIGVGLFIDEVGKFITQTNDYFYPAAAPIIYAFFLLTVLLYLQIRRPPSRNARAELYRALDALEEVLEHDLDAQEQAELELRLRYVAQHASQPDLVRLADALRDFVTSDAIHLAPVAPSFWDRWRKRAQSFEAGWVTQRRLKMILMVGLGAVGLPGLLALVLLLARGLVPAYLQEEIGVITIAFAQGTNVSGLRAVMTRLVLEGVAGLPLLVAAGWLAIGQERRGIVVAYVGLLLSLTIVNVLVFYFDQFHAVIDTLLQFALLLGTIHYRRRYLTA